MKTITLYKVNAYEAYTAAEQNTRWFKEIPDDTIYYKYEVLESKTFGLPDELGDDEDFVLHTEKDGRPFIETIDAVYYLEEVKEYYVIASTEYELNMPDLFVMDGDGNYYGAVKSSFPAIRNYPKNPDYWVTAEGSDAYRPFNIDKVWIPVAKVDEFDQLVKALERNKAEWPEFRKYPSPSDYKTKKDYKKATDDYMAEYKEWGKKVNISKYWETENELSHKSRKLFCSFSEKVYEAIKDNDYIKECFR